MIGYFDDTYPIIVSTHNWIFEGAPDIAVDSARLYVMAGAEGIKGLDHALANVKEDERRLIEFGDPKWSDYRFNSSHDGRYVSFRHTHKVLTDQGKQTKRSTKWLMQSNETDDRRSKRVTFDGEDSHSGVLSRDGETLCFYSYKDSITHVYRVREDAGKDHVVIMKCELDGETRAISGNANRVIVVKAEQLEIHDISKDASKLVCQFDAAGFAYECALNEDGSEAAFVSYVSGEVRIRIMKVDKVAGDKADQPAIVVVKFPRSVGRVWKLIYADGDKLHVLQTGGKVSLFDPSTKELVLLEAPQEEMVVGWAISPNADYISILQKSDKVGKNGRPIYRTIVKRKLGKPDQMNLFGCSL